MKKDAIKLDWDVAFQGKANGNRHLFRVNKIIRYLVTKEGGDPFIAQSGGWIHDVSLAWGSDYDQKHVEKYTKKFLKSYKNLQTNEFKKILECATLHENGGKSSNIEARIVHDADILDKSGLLGVIRHIWKMTNLLENKILVNEKDFLKLNRHLSKRRSQLYTKTGIKLAGILNKQSEMFFSKNKYSLKLMNAISTKASLGLTSDRIAKSLLKDKKSILFNKLKSQLSCEYLKKTTSNI